VSEVPSDRCLQAISDGINEEIIMGTIGNPRGNLSSICKVLKQFARYGDVEGIRIYVRGGGFLACFNRLDPERRHSAMLAYAEAHALCEARAKLRLAAPLARFARCRDVAGIRSYVRSGAFLAGFNRLDPEHRHTAMMACIEAHALCEAKAQLPLAVPIPLNARTSAKLAKWRHDPVMLAKLADAYARARDHEEAARLLGVTVGAARLAKRRYLDRAATNTRLKGP
jgi:hypothetical protein